MKKKTLIKLFLISTVCLFVAGCSKNVATVTPIQETNVEQETDMETVETERNIASIEETVQSITSETVVKGNNISKDNNGSEEVIEDATIAPESEAKLTEVKKIDKNKAGFVPGMPSSDLEKYNNYKASVESADTVEISKQTEQKTATSKQKGVKEKGNQSPIEVVNPVTEATTTNVSQEMANLLNAKRKELGFPQTVEVIPESDVATHNAMKQATINLGVIEFSHNPTVDGTGLKLAGTVIGKSTNKDSATMFNSWMNSPGHYKTIIPNDEFHIYPEDVMQVVCYVYGPYDGNYYYNLTYRFKPKEEKREDWQQPYVNTTPSEPTPGVADNPNEQPGSSVYVEGQTGYVDNYIDEDILNRLAGTDDFMPFFNSCSPELQEHYRAKHPELFN